MKEKSFQSLINQSITTTLTNVEIERKLNEYSPRPYQRPILTALQEGFKRVLAILPRRAGKDITALNYVIREMWQHPGVYYYIFPTYSQAKKVIWDSMTNDGKRILDYFPQDLIIQKNSQEMKIRMEGKNNKESLFQLVGSDNFDSLMGTNPRGVVFSEYALQDPRAYQYIRPILTANQGWALFISTPRGKNHLWQLAELARVSPEWFYIKLSVDDTEHIPLEEIEKERREGLMSEDMIQQEYYCFPPTAPILTPEGIKDIQKIKDGDVVFSHSGRIRKVMGTLSRDYDGDLIQIKTYGNYEDILCTPNHPVRVYRPQTQSYVWMQAQFITDKSLLVFPKIQKSFNRKISKSLCMLMAWYITEGSTFKNGVNFTLKDMKEALIVIELLHEEGYNYSIHKKDNVVNLIVRSSSLHDFLRKECGSVSHEKIIPFHLISGWEDEFFEEIMKGDGHEIIDRSDSRKFIYTTNSKSLAYHYQMLINSVSHNYSASIAYRKGGNATFPNGKTYNCRDSYSVVVYEPTKNEIKKGVFLKRGKHGVGAKVRSVDRVKFKGTVHNIKVQYDESYIAYGRAVHNCSFEMGVEGSYYAKYMDKMRREGRIDEVPWENGFKVHTAWDIGVRDATTIIFFQTIGQTVRIIDVYENSKEGLEHYANIVLGKPYTYGVHIAPHDIRVKEWGAGITRLEKARQLGIKFTLSNSHEVADGIEACRSLFSKLWIDKSCEPLIKALENYRQEYDVKRKVYNSKPLHDWSSHFADAFRYLAVSLPKTRDSLSAEGLEERYQKAMYGAQHKLPPFFREGGNTEKWR